MPAPRGDVSVATRATPKRAASCKAWALIKNVSSVQVRPASTYTTGTGALAAAFGGINTAKRASNPNAAD